MLYFEINGYKKTHSALVCFEINGYKKTHSAMLWYAIKRHI